MRGADDLFKIKPPEWVEYHPGHWEAKLLYGTARIRPCDDFPDLVLMWCPGINETCCPSVEAAKEEAEHHYAMLLLPFLERARVEEKP